MLGLIKRVQVMEYQTGVLYERGRVAKTVGAGVYTLVRPVLRQEMAVVDMRLAAVLVAGQEILTADQLPLRLTILAQYRVVDAVKALNTVRNYLEYLYELLQLEARAAVAAKALDALLADKTALAEDLAAKVRPRAAEAGLEVGAVGLKDVVLPGEVKAMVAKEAEAVRLARAALVTAREELAAARTQANTAKLIAENPAILKLKELQALTEMAKKPGTTLVLGDMPWKKPG